MEANPLGELFLPRMNDARKKRVKHRAIHMITRLSVRLSATRLQEYGALKSMWKEKGKGKGKRKEKGKNKRKGKEKGKNKDKLKEGTSDTSNTKCSFCK